MLPAPLHPPLSGFHITKQQERKAKTKQVSVTSNIHAAKCTEYLSDLFVSKYHLTQWTVSSISEHSLLGFYRIPHSVVFQLLLCFFHCFARSSRLGNGKVWWFLQGLVLCLLFLGTSAFFLIHSIPMMIYFSQESLKQNFQKKKKKKTTFFTRFYHFVSSTK